MATGRANPYRAASQSSAGYQPKQQSSTRSATLGPPRGSFNATPGYGQQPNSARSTPTQQPPRQQLQPARQQPQPARQDRQEPTAPPRKDSDVVSVMTDDPRLNKDPDEYGRTDLKGLLKFLDVLIKEKIRFTEVTYVINHWKLYGIIPLKHHGFVLPCRSSANNLGFLSLDFGSKGILWDVDDEFPELPDNTFFARSYKIDVDPMTLKLYCQRTKPFDWFTNECSSWSAGLLKILRVHDSKGRKQCNSTADLLEDTAFPRRDSVGSAQEAYEIQEPEAGCGVHVLNGAPTCFGGRTPRRTPRHRLPSDEATDPRFVEMYTHEDENADPRCGA